MNGLDYHGGQAIAGSSGAEIRQVSFREQIENNMNFHERELEKSKEMLKLLDENPAIARFMELSR